MLRTGRQFTVRTLCIATALVGINLAAAIESWRSQWSPNRIDGPWDKLGGSGPFVSPGKDGTFHHGVSVSLETGDSFDFAVLLLPRRSLVQSWSPWIAGMLATLLILGTLRRGRSEEPHSPSAAMDPSPTPPGSSKRRKIRLAIVVLAILAMNGVSFVYIPEISSDRIPRDSSELANLIPELLMMRNRPPALIAVQNGRRVIVWGDGHNIPIDSSEGKNHVLETFVIQPDGAVVAYEGSPGLLRRLFTQARVVRGPIHSWLEMWWLPVDSLMITLLTIGKVRLMVRP